jgi:uncharacterized membrane protein
MVTPVRVIVRLFELTDGKRTNDSRAQPSIEVPERIGPSNIVVAPRVSVPGATILTEKIAGEETGEAPREGEPMTFDFSAPHQSRDFLYRLQVSARDELEQFANQKVSTEATLANNSRMVVVDRGRGPYRVLYGGAPELEFVLNRALTEDDQVRLSALIRVAKREPKFQFKGRAGESSNPLFRGFDKQGDDTERMINQCLRCLPGMRARNCKAGFLKRLKNCTDTTRSSWTTWKRNFSHDQMVLLEKFVSERGGGFLMLGGMESFHQGKYDRTPIADLLPVYLDRVPAGQPLKDLCWSSRGSWLQPWARLRSTEEDERARLKAMPPLQVLNRVRDKKPGASELARLADSEGKKHPALIVQRFGRGRSASLTVGDMWRWGMHDEAMMRDLGKFWRQTTRWLVADVPNRVELLTEQKASDQNQSLSLQVRVRDKKFQPLENANVQLKVRFVGSQPPNSWWNQRNISYGRPHPCYGQQGRSSLR